MTVRVKICGINDDRALEAALDGGADYVGMVFYPPSPRAISLGQAAALADQAGGRAHRVGVFVDPDDATLERVLSTVSLDYIQLHGHESPTRVAEVARLTGCSMIKALAIGTALDLARADDYEAGDMLLLDAKVEAGKGLDLPGGNGVAFPWPVVKQSVISIPWFLSGGLDATNVRRAITESGAGLVDVSSGVESEPGVKDIDQIYRFLAAAKPEGSTIH